MTDVRNEAPLHSHTDEDGPWTQDTMLAHLRYLHGVGGLPDDAPVTRTGPLHDELNHGGPPAKPASSDEMIFAEALSPPRLYKSITLGEVKWGNEGDTGLFFEGASGNGTNVVNLRPGDLPLLRAACIPESPGLTGLQDIWSANVGPGGRRAVEAGHAAGRRLGVDDMTRAYEDGGFALVPRQALEYLLAHYADEVHGTPDRSHWKLPLLAAAVNQLSQAARRD